MPERRVRRLSLCQRSAPGVCADIYCCLEQTLVFLFSWKL